MKRKILVLISVLVATSFLITGCFFGSSSTDRDKGYGYINADFTMRTSSGRLYLDASSSEFKNYSNPEYLWEVNGTSYTGRKVDMTTPSERTEIKLKIKAVDSSGKASTATTSKTFRPDKDEDPATDVSFSHERRGTREYKFVGSKPTNGKYWEWKMPGENYWHGYKDENVFTYKFSSSGEKEVKLRIEDSSGNIIGQTSKTINVY